MENKVSKKAKDLQSIVLNTLNKVAGLITISSRIANHNPEYISVKSILMKPDKTSRLTFNVYLNKYNNNLYVYSSESNIIIKFYENFLTEEFIIDTQEIVDKFYEISNKWNLTKNKTINIFNEINVVESKNATNSIIKDSYLYTISLSLLGVVNFNKTIYKSMPAFRSVNSLPKMIYKDGTIKSSYYFKLDLGDYSVTFSERDSYNNSKDFYKNIEEQFIRFELNCKKFIIKEIKRFYPEYKESMIIDYSDNDLITLAKMIDLVDY